MTQPSSLIQRRRSRVLGRNDPCSRPGVRWPNQVGTKRRNTMAERDPRTQAQAARQGGGGAGQALALSTAGFAVTFWAWALLSPLGASLREELSLSAFQQSLLVAVPVIVGSVGRIPVGALTD